MLAFLYILSTTPLDSTQAVGTAIFAAITQGILVAGAAVLGNQIVKQGKKAETNTYLEAVTDIKEYNPEDGNITNTEESEEDTSDGSLSADKESHTKDKDD